MNVRRYFVYAMFCSYIVWPNILLALKPVTLVAIPKSGTNLVSRILCKGTGNDKQASYTYFPPSSILSAVCPMSFSGNHFFFSEELYQALTRNDGVIIFLQRDPRDMVTSFARNRKKKGFGKMKLKEMPLDKLISDFILCPYTWMLGPAHRYYNEISRLAANIHTLYESYFGWTQKEKVFVLRYEDLLGGKEGSLEKRERVLRELFAFIELDISYEQIKEIARSIDSMHVATFTPGQKIGRWKQFWTPEHCRQFDAVADGLLERFGYEK